MANAQIYSHPGTAQLGLIPGPYVSWFFPFPFTGWNEINVGMWWSACSAVDNEAVPVEATEWWGRLSLVSFGLYSSDTTGYAGESPSSQYAGYVNCPDSSVDSRYRVVSSTEHQVVNIDDNDGRVGRIRGTVTGSHWQTEIVSPLRNSGDEMATTTDYAAFYALKFKILNSGLSNQKIEISPCSGQPHTSTPNLASLKQNFTDVGFDAPAGEFDWQLSGNPFAIPTTVLVRNGGLFRFRVYSIGIQRIS